MAKGNRIVSFACGLGAACIVAGGSVAGGAAVAAGGAGVAAVVAGGAAIAGAAIATLAAVAIVIAAVSDLPRPAPFIAGAFTGLAAVGSLIYALQAGPAEAAARPASPAHAAAALENHGTPLAAAFEGAAEPAGGKLAQDNVIHASTISGTRASEVSDPRPGNIVEDGSVYAGHVTRTDKPLYTTRTDAPGRYGWRDASAYCEALVAHRHNDWRLPRYDELAVLFNNRAAIGDFHTDASHPGRWYWSSTEGPGAPAYAWRLNFSDGAEDWSLKNAPTSFRCVRTG